MSEQANIRRQLDSLMENNHQVNKRDAVETNEMKGKGYRQAEASGTADKRRKKRKG